MGTELHTPSWLIVAEDLFYGEFKDQKSFLRHFDAPATLYHELAKRLVKRAIDIEAGPTPLVSDSDSSYHYVSMHLDSALDAAAYHMMEEYYREDAVNNNSIKLNELICRYEELNRKG